MNDVLVPAYTLRGTNGSNGAVVVVGAAVVVVGAGVVVVTSITWGASISVMNTSRYMSGLAIWNRARRTPSET